MATGRDLRSESTGDLIRRVRNDLQGLLDRQVELVKLELEEDRQQVIQAGKTLGVGLGLLLAAAICFFNTLFFGIERLWPGWAWLAALIFTLVFTVVGLIVTRRGRAEVKVQPLTRTRETLKEEAEWVKHPLTPNGKSSSSATISPRPSAN
jgi:uncharacterized membrane protein YqjE